MNINDFFDNLKCKFSDDETTSAAVDCSVIRNENGEIEEIQIYNEEYEEILIIERNKHIEVLNIKEFEANR